MIKYIVSLGLFLSACSSPSAVSTYEAEYEAEEQQKAAEIEAAVKKGDLKLSREYYLPNLEDERKFKVVDQYGCVWWITNGHKFDDKEIDVLENGEANCPDPKYAPPKEYIYRNRAGQHVPTTDSGNEL